MIQREIDIASYLPKIIKEIKEFQEISKAENPEISLMWNNIQNIFDDQFVTTSSLEFIKRREKVLGIQAESTTESLDFRKKRIINRYSMSLPFTVRYLQERLDFLVGKGKTVASIDVQEFILIVEAAIEDAGLFKEVERTIYTTKPANMLYKQRTTLGSNIAIEEHIILNQLERKTRLGTTWRLGTIPFARLKGEVIIK